MKFIYIFLLLASGVSFSKNQELTYDPSVVQLTGTLDLQTFPGPPNYENIKSGDEIEKHFYIQLDHPIDIIPKGNHPEVENAEKELNVKTIQLSIGADEELWMHFRKLAKNAHVKLTGKLFHRFTGHHHSRVLLNVKTMTPLKN